MPSGESPQVRKILDTFKTFRELGILTSQTNQCFRSIVLPAVLCFLAAVNIFGTSLALSPNPERVSYLMNFLTEFMTLEAIIAILGLGTLAGLVNKRSIQCINKIKRMSLQS